MTKLAKYSLSTGLSHVLANERCILNYEYRHTVFLLLFVAAAALVLSTIYLILARIFTKAIMHITLILSIVLNMYVPNLI